MCILILNRWNDATVHEMKSIIDFQTTIDVNNNNGG